MIALLIILSYFIIGGVVARVDMPRQWRIEIADHPYDMRLARRHVVNRSALAFFFWLGYLPVNIIAGSVDRTNPEAKMVEIKELERAAIEQKKKTLQETKAMRREINLLESANGMELSKWED